MQTQSEPGNIGKNRAVGDTVQSAKSMSVSERTVSALKVTCSFLNQKEQRNLKPMLGVGLMDCAGQLKNISQFLDLAFGY